LDLPGFLGEEGEALRDYSFDRHLFEEQELVRGEADDVSSHRGERVCGRAEVARDLVVDPIAPLEGALDEALEEGEMDRFGAGGAPEEIGGEGTGLVDANEDIESRSAGVECAHRAA
jgi:hypothetical protein